MRRFNISKIVQILIRVVLAFAFVTAIFTGLYLNAFTSFLAFVLSFLPAGVSLKGKIYLSPGFQTTIVVFIFASMYLGEIKGYYEIFPWWDVMLHSISGVILGLIGFLLVYALNADKRATVILSPIFISIFAFTFALSAGVIWEIFEYTMDKIFSMNMQKDGLNDTMWDLICDTGSALVTSVFGYIVSKKQKLKEEKIEKE